MDVEGQAVGLPVLIRALVDRRLKFRTARPAPSGIIRVHREIRECACGSFVSVIGTSVERYCRCGPVPVRTARTADVQELLDEAVEMAIEAGKLIEWPDAPFAHESCPSCGRSHDWRPTRHDDRVVLTVEGELAGRCDDLPSRRHRCLEQPTQAPPR